MKAMLIITLLIGLLIGTLLGGFLQIKAEDYDEIYYLKKILISVEDIEKDVSYFRRYHINVTTSD